MATGFGGDDDRAIFDSGNAADDELDNGTILTEDDQSLSEPRSAEDTAVSDAIRQIHRGASPALPVAPQLPRLAAAQPGDVPGDDGTEDRSTAGVLRALLDEREKRRAAEDRAARYERQEQDRTRTADVAPLHERIFSEPDQAIAELTRTIVDPLNERIENMRVQHDLALASVRHADTFQDAWAAWYQKVGTGQDAETYFKIMRAPSPGEALVSWFKGEQRQSTIGDDLDAYNARVIREAFEARGLPVPPEYAGAPAGQQPQTPVAPQGGTGRDPATGRFAPSQPQAPRYPTATSRMGQSGGGLNDRDEDGTDAAIFDSGRPERGKAR